MIKLESSQSLPLRRGRWLAFALVSISYLLVYSQRTGPGVIANKLQSEFHVSAAELGLISSIQYLLYMILQIPVGVMADGMGPARLLVAGMALDGFGTILFSISPNFHVLLISRGFVGLGDALIWVNIVLILGRRFAASQFGTVLGMVGTAGNLGALLTTIPLATWIAAAGWHGPFLVLGIALVGMGILDFLALIGMRGQREYPSLSQLERLGADTIRLKQVNVWQLLKLVVRDRVAWSTFACHCGAMGAYLGFTSIWAVPYYMDTYAMSRVAASTLTFTAFVGAMVGGPIIGTVSDRLGSRRIPYLVLEGIGLLSWLSFSAFGGHPSLWWAYVAMFLVGVVCGGSLLTFTVIRDQTPADRGGVTSGFANTGGYISAVLVPVLFGAVIDWLGGGRSSGSTLDHAYAIAFLIPAFFSAIGVVGSATIRDIVRPSQHESYRAAER